MNASPTDDNEDGQLLRYVASTLQTCVTRQPATAAATMPQSLAERPVLGTFVSLKRHGALRSCCGSLGQLVPLAKSLAHSAERTASDDPRFPPVSPSELPFLGLEVWLLADMQPVAAKGTARIASVVIGKHGLQIARGAAKGLLLPGVAVDHGPVAARDGNWHRSVCGRHGL